MPPRTRIASEEDAWAIALGMLARKARTRAEVAQALRDKGADESIIESVLGRLSAHRHVDDEALAHDHAFSLIEGKHLSPEAAVARLVERGVETAAARSAVDVACEGRSETELCARALERRLRGKGLAPSMADREGRALARLGYEAEIIARVLEQAAAGQSVFDEA